ncbi:hypothetical protein FA95DRAFT_1599159, partial [Auriscalpium vulgare]
MLFALFFIVAAVQLLKLGGPINHIHQHFLDRLTLGGRPRISLLPAAPAHIESTPVAFPGSLPVAIVDPVPSSSWEVVEVVNAPQPSSGHAVSPAETAPAALNLQPRDHRQLESSILDHVQPYAAALLAGVLVVILVTVLVRVAATYARGHALIKAQLADFEKRELAQSAELAKLQAASIADAQLSDSSIRSLRNDKNVLAQRTREQESLIRQKTTQAEAAKNELLEHVLEFDGQAGLLRAARDEADRQSRYVEQLNATIADMQSREIALRAQLETQAEDARVREDELCHARDEELCDLQKAAFDCEQQATQLRAALADAEAGVERHRQGSAATISSLRLVSDALQTELERVRGELILVQGEAATFDRETVKLRGELYQALRSARISAAEQDATIGALSSQLLDVQQQLVAVKQQAAEDVQELEALLISKADSAQWAVATLGGAVKDLVDDLELAADQSRQQESLIRQMTTQAEAAKNERLEHVLEFDGQAGLLRAARDEADRQSRVVEQLNATIADMQSREIALRAQLETQAEDARVREDELCHARDEELCDLQKAAFDSEQQATQLRAALADAEAGVERHRQDSAATISSLRLASDALQTELARVRGELTMAQDEAATFDRETVKLRGELYQALRSARISTAEQDATIGTLSAQLLDIQEQLVAVKQQAAEDVQELEALLISRDASAQLAVATLSGAVKDVVDDLELSADVQPTRAPVPELTVEELGPVEEADYDEDCSCTPIPAMVDRWLANYHATPSPQSAHSVASSPSCYSPGSSPIVGRMDVLFPVLANFDSSLHASTSTDSDLFGPSAPASFIRERNISAEPCGSPADAQMALVDDLRERIADLEWERADDAAYIEDLEDKLERIEAAMEETARVDNVVAASSLRLVGLEQEELATR